MRLRIIEQSDFRKEKLKKYEKLQARAQAEKLCY